MDSRYVESLVEPLTPREAEILNWLSTGSSNTDIAEELVITLATVKFHNKNIYSKLGVTTRQEAVARARALGLLDDQVTGSIFTKHNLPAQTTPFIGRKQELSEIATLLGKDDVRLVTILAPGGMGKTRLALAMASQLAGQQTVSADPFEHGVYFVPLQPLTDPANIVSAIAEHSGYQFQGGDRSARQQLLEYLREKKMLLVLDNFEHLLDGAGIVTDILETAPGLKILSTSRERLNLGSETVYAISGMPFPDWETPEDALEYDTVKLFLQSATRTKPDFELQGDELKYLARICRLTEGMPLAILLGAAWVDVLSLQEIAAEIQRSIDFLAGGMRDMPQRQRSIRAVFEPTWNRLTEEEQTVFMKFAVFRGGCTREAAQGITGANLRHLQTFATKALLTRTPAGRYEIHELLRQYIEEELEHSGDSDEAYDRHCNYYLDAVTKREADIKGRRQLDALDEIESDFENVRAAWHRAFESEQYEYIGRSVESLAWFCHMRSRRHDGDELFGEVQDRVPDHLGSLWGRLAIRHAMFFGKHDADARDAAVRSLAIARGNKDLREIIFCTFALGNEPFFPIQDPDEARAYLEESLALCRKLDDKFYMAQVYRALGHIGLLYTGEPQKTYEAYRQSADLSRQIGDRAGLAEVLNNLGLAADNLGNRDQSIRNRIDALSIGYELGSGLVISWSSSWLAIEYLFDGQIEEAKIRVQTGLEVAQFIEYPWCLGTAWLVRGLISAIEGHYPVARQHLEKARTYTADRGISAAIDFGLSVVACEMDDPLGARTRVCASLNFWNMTGNMKIATSHLPVFASIRAYEGQKEQAAELLGLAFEYPFGASRMFEQWHMVTRLRAGLENELGAEVYNAAWERGSHLALEGVIQDILAECGDDHT